MSELARKRLVFLGAPGAGKGTQAKIASEKFGIPAISTGDILRAAIKAETPLGKTAKSFVESGGLVPDEVVIGIIEERLKQPDCANGYILDGFPRTVVQAGALDEMTTRLGASLDGVIYFEVPIDELVKRLSGRRVCRHCGATYHVLTLKSKTEGVCDSCDGELYQRADDSQESVRNRLSVYEAQTSPLINYYRERGSLFTVEASGSIDEIFGRLSEILGGAAS